MNNNNQNNNEYNIKLYNSVFNNKYLRKIIFYHLNIFNILYNNIEFKSCEEWNQFKYKEYLNNVSFLFEFNFSQLNENIKHINILSLSTIISTAIDNSNNSNNNIPNHINSISIKIFKIKDLNSPLINSIRSSPTFRSKLIEISINDINTIEILPYSIPISVSNLKTHQLTITKLKKNSLPANLKKLSLYTESLDCFPSSLTDLYLSTSNELILNHLSSLTNLTRFEFLSGYESNINGVIFPNSLKELIINCSTFNSTLPNSLKLFKLDIAYYMYEIHFPTSLEFLLIDFEDCRRNEEIFKNIQYFLEVPPNLKTLDLTTYSSLIDSQGHSILPDTLEKLYIKSFVKSIQIVQLPSSLTHLNLEYKFNQVIEVNVLPVNLKKLVLGMSYTQIINPLAIPQNLETLEIQNIRYSNYIDLSSHPKLSIKCYSLNLYYNSTNQDIQSLCLPNNFNSSLSTLQLQNKSKLEYLHLGDSFNQEIQLSDLPVQNNIKTLEFGPNFKNTINLEYFQNLETLIINYSKLNNSPPTITTSTTTIINSNNNNQIINYNNFSLKNIIVTPDFKEIIKYFDSNFYQFIKLKHN